MKPEFFATIGFPLLAESLANFRRSNKAHAIEVAGVVVNNAFYHGGNDGGPEKERAMRAIHKECDKNGWHIFKKQMYHSRGYGSPVGSASPRRLGRETSWVERRPATPHRDKRRTASD